jgi:hypothetical protein
MADNTMKSSVPTNINWRLGALRLWMVASFLWCCAVFSVTLLDNPNASWFSVGSLTVHVKFSNSVTWDFPAEWGVQRITDDLEKRVAEEEKKDRDWAAQLPASVKEKCSAIRSTIPFADQPADCVRLFFINDSLAVPTGWETQIETARVSAWRLLAAAAPFAIAPPLVVLALGAFLAWALAGFRRSSS